VQEFLIVALGTEVVVEAMDVDVPTAVRRLSGKVSRFAVRSVKVEHYSPKSYMAGPFSPRFSDSDHGMDFIEANPDAITSAKVTFFATAGMVTLSLNRVSCFRYTCYEDDNDMVESLLKTLI
jgi:hypothetical protein